MRHCPHGYPIRCIGRGVSAIALLVCAAGLAAAGSAGEPPEGLPAGRWVLAPYVYSELAHDSNVFRRPPGPDVVADQYTEVTAGLAALLPFHRNFLELTYEANQPRYNTVSVPRNLRQDLGATVGFLFRSKDRLVLAERYTESFALGQVRDSGELTFEGQPYNFNLLQASVSRGVFGKPGYSVVLSDVRLRFAEVTEQGFFNYEGYDLALEYRHPLPARRWLIGYLQGRRFDHLDPSGTLLPNEPFRTEVSSNAQLGLRGLLGKTQQFVFRLGYGTFEYADDKIAESLDIPSSEFQGMTSYLRWSYQIGDRSELEFEFERRPTPSSSGTFIVDNEFGLEFERRLSRRSEIKVGLLLERSLYNNPLLVNPNFDADEPLGPGNEFCSWFGRRGAEVEFDWLIHRRFGFRATAGHVDRDADCQSLRYVSTVISAGVTLGWF